MEYLLLAAVGLILMVAAVSRCERKATAVAVFVVAMTVVGLADWTAFGFFLMYDYRPGLVANHLMDAALGELLAEFLFVAPLTVVLVTGTEPLVGTIAGTALVTAIQHIFRIQGIFVARHWSAAATAVGFLVFFMLLEAFGHAFETFGWKNALLRRITKTSVLFCAMAAFTLFLRGTGVVETNLALLPTPAGNRSLARFLSYAVVGVPLGYWAIAAKGYARYVRLGAAALFYAAADSVFVMLRIAFFRPPWNIPLDAAAMTLAIGAGGLIIDWLVRRSRVEI